MTDAEDFWQFSLAHYRRPGVADQCLRLQDVWQVNINLLLWLFWLAERGLKADEVVILEAHCAIREWHREVTQPLRLLRRRLQQMNRKGDAGKFVAEYQQVKAVELASEQVEQRYLVGLKALLASPTDSGSNVRRYLMMLKVPEEEQRLLLTLLTGMP